MKLTFSDSYRQLFPHVTWDRESYKAATLYLTNSLLVLVKNVRGEGIQRYTRSVVYRMYYSYLLGRYGLLGPVLPLNSERLYSETQGYTYKYESKEFPRECLVAKTRENTGLLHTWFSRTSLSA